jgi:hypothetical protein
MLSRLRRLFSRRKRNRFPYGIPRVDTYGNTVITYYTEDPFWDHTESGR